MQRRSAAAVALFVASAAWAGVPAKLEPDKKRGQLLYERNCWQCHGKQGLGDGPLAASLPEGMPALAGRIQRDGFDEAVALTRAGRGDMPGFADVMDTYDARRVFIWLASLDESGAPRDQGDKDDEGEDDSPAAGEEGGDGPDDPAEAGE